MPTKAERHAAWATHLQHRSVKLLKCTSTIGFTCRCFFKSLNKTLPVVDVLFNVSLPEHLKRHCKIYHLECLELRRSVCSPQQQLSHILRVLLLKLVSSQHEQKNCKHQKLNGTSSLCIYIIAFVYILYIYSLTIYIYIYII